MDAHRDIADLAEVHRSIQHLDEQGILKLASAATSAEHGGWFTRARAIGELQRRAGYKEAAVVKYAKRLGMGKTLAFELGAIDRKILLPRLRDDGDDAKFPLREKKFYAEAVRLAPMVKRSALAVLVIAEQARAKDRRFTAKRLREQLGLPAESNPTKGIGRCLATLGKLDAKTRERFARAVKDPAGVVDLAEATAENARALADELRTRGGR